MDEATQQNAALVEQASAASQAMRDQAARLAQLVGTFTVAGGAAARATKAPRPAARPRLAVVGVTSGWETF
jgi:methyl-accepting chemotaxis protein